jgi:hypothetical protein
MFEEAEPLLWPAAGPATQHTLGYDANQRGAIRRGQDLVLTLGAWPIRPLVRVRLPWLG